MEKQKQKISMQLSSCVTNCGQVSSASGNRSIISMFKKQWNDVDKTTPQPTNKSVIIIDLNDKEYADAAKHDQCSDVAKCDKECSDAGRHDTSPTGKLSLSRIRRSNRLSLKRHRTSTLETAKDVEDSIPDETSAYTGSNIQCHSSVVDGPHIKRRAQKVAVDRFDNNTESQKEIQGVSSSGWSQNQNVYSTTPSERVTQPDPHMHDSEIKLHKMETSEIKLDVTSVQVQDNIILDTELNDDGGVCLAEYPGDSTGTAAQVPYYLENFLYVLKMVTEDEFYKELFNEEDRMIMTTFEELPGAAQKLYIRLFQRHHHWIRHAKIVYPKIADDLTDTLKELTKSKFLLDEANLTDLSEILHTLPAPSLKKLAVSFRLNPGQPRSQLTDSIMKHGRQKNIGSFFTGSPGGNADTISRRARRLLGPCYKVAETRRALLMRVLMLFALHHTRGDEDDGSSAQQQLFQMLMSNTDQIKYPEYSISRKSRIFPDRDSLLRFTSAVQCETNIRDALEKKAFDKALLTYTDAIEKALELHSNDTIVSYDRGLPEHLRVYTAGSVWVRVLTLGVELLQFVKEYTAATQQLESLLAQTVYHPDYRGRWYDRLALNLDHHLKERDKALDIIGHALVDPRVRAGHRYSLFLRAQRLCRSFKTLKTRWTEFEDDKFSEVMEAPKVTIMARQPVHAIPGAGPLYISQQSDASGNVTYLKRVEDVALQHYSSIGFPCVQTGLVCYDGKQHVIVGIHGEGSTFVTFLCLLLWDNVFCQDKVDVFYTHYQTYPLDLFTDHFYASRQSAIDDRLTTLRESSHQELLAMLESSWDAHIDTCCLGLNRDRFTGLDEAQGLLECLGGEVVAGILGRLSRDLRHTAAGMPDLVVWNTHTKKVKLVEVKGPGDRLSTKQILWLDYLHTLGVDVEVCHVQAVGAKKLQTSGAKMEAE